MCIMIIIVTNCELMVNVTTNNVIANITTARRVLFYHLNMLRVTPPPPPFAQPCWDYVDVNNTLKLSTLKIINAETQMQFVDAITH